MFSGVINESAPGEMTSDRAADRLATNGADMHITAEHDAATLR